MVETKRCRLCGIALNEDNWKDYNAKTNRMTCVNCNKILAHKRYVINSEMIKKRTALWQKAHPEKVRGYQTKHRRNNGGRSYKENRSCASYLGVYVAERVLSHVFKDVERMPFDNPGYDFICNKGKKIDIKSICSHSKGRSLLCWRFSIRRNKIADYFLCLAFDNREDLNPLHIWLIPGHIVNHLHGASISITTIDKWSKYELAEKLNDVVTCCNIIKVGE